MQFVSLHPWQFGFELTEILLGERKADGWVLFKEIEKCRRMWQEDFLLLILCDFVCMCIYKGYRRIPFYPFRSYFENDRVVQSC